MSSIPNVNPSIETLRTDTKAAVDFVESFFSGKQQKAVSTDEERRALLEKLMVAQKTVDDSKRFESIEKIKAQIKAHDDLYTDFKITAADLGLTISDKTTTRGAKAGTTKEPAAKITIRYMNEHSQPDQVEIGVKGPAPADNPSLKAFLAYAKDTKSKSRKDLDVTTMSIEEFRETFQGYKYAE